MATILLLGLENDLAAPLSRILRKHEHDVEIAASMEAALGASDIDIVFAGGDGANYRDVVRQFRSARPDVRLVLVNRLPENSRWLDALELGATDYCGAPFESVQMRWLVDSVMRQSAVRPMVNYA